MKALKPESKPLLSLSAYILVFLAVALLLLASCQSSEKNPSCHEPDWYERGRVAGMQGQVQNFKTKNFYLCDLKSESKNKALFKNGYRDGINSYCQKDNFFNMGQSDLPLHISVCPKELHFDLSKSYRSGIETLQKTL